MTNNKNLKSIYNLAQIKYKILGDLDKLVETKVKKFNSDIGKLKPPVITAQSIFAPKTGW